MSKLQSLFTQSQLVVCLGSGGVGKTTVAAALALISASRGRRTLCLTVDPSKRLARALGLRGEGSAVHTVDPSPFAQTGRSLSAELLVKQVDTGAILDGLVHRYAPSDAAKDRILKSPFYRHVSTYLAGMQEYMAMEALFEVTEQGDFDVVILDTPPTSNAIDFLDAPERMRGILNSPATGWLVDTAKGTSKIFGRGAKVMLQGFSRFTGSGFLEEISQFLMDMNVMFDGFESRAARVAELLRAPETLRLTVTRATEAHLEEARVLEALLKERSMAAHGRVVNAVPAFYGSDADRGNDASDSDRARWQSWANDQGLGEPLVDRIWEASAWHQSRIRSARQLLESDASTTNEEGGSPEILTISELGSHLLHEGPGTEAARLSEVARSLENAL